MRRSTARKLSHRKIERSGTRLLLGIRYSLWWRPARIPRRGRRGSRRWRRRRARVPRSACTGRRRGWRGGAPASRAPRRVRARAAPPLRQTTRPLPTPAYSPPSTDTNTRHASRATHAPTRPRAHATRVPVSPPQHTHSTAHASRPLLSWTSIA